MREAEAVLGVLRERGRRGLPLERLYRQLFNPQLYLLAYGRLYSNKGAMTPGPDGETVDGMSLGKIERIIDALRHERFRFKPVRRCPFTGPVELGRCAGFDLGGPCRRVGLIFGRGLAGCRRARSPDLCAVGGVGGGAVGA